MYARFLDSDFVGTDSLPAIQASQVHSWSDFFGLWHEPLMAGTDFVLSQAVFYRPIASLSFAADYALWGTNPVGYHVTNILLQLAATVLAYYLLRELHLSWPAALAGAALLGFHPTMVTAVPVIARRYDALSAALLFASLALLLRRHTVWSLVVLAASLLAKESAFAAIPLLPLVLYAAWHTPEASSRPSLAAYVRSTAPFVVVGVVVFALRYAVLGTLGGHASVDIFTTNFEEYRVMLDRYVLFVFWPFRAWYPEHTAGWLALVLAAVVLLGLILARTDVTTRVRTAVGLAWTVGFGAFFIGLRHIAGPWYMYYPLLGMALAVGAAADGMWRTLHRRVPTEVLATAGLGALALLYTVGSLVTSPLVQPWAQWHQAGLVMREYLAGIQACTDRIPDGVAVTLWNSPALYDDGSDESALLAATMIEGFTYDAYVHLIHPDQHFNLFIGQPQTYHSAPSDLQLSCDWAGPDRRRVIATSASLPAPRFPSD
ncbi:MAG: hypothetical protein JO020_02795 [Chloroflexi bacterium]|nr:hypothetical protein [Chloroflexota bacterium]